MNALIIINKHIQRHLKNMKSRTEERQAVTKDFLASNVLCVCFV